ncbi:MAG: hypothetical protein AUK44_06705 [Porphyromonadaceae bacterium CG2_30_38_12]|nr:MAG: hypothetical protein AUK44_06705 [Porphyromonadaceae bacterium CG2_30_38_12]
MVHYISKSQSNSTLIEREDFLSTFQLPSNTAHVRLQTCDRVEFYWGEGTIPENIYRHLFSIVSGLDSSLIGECAIQGQVKTCYEEAAQKFKLSASLHKLFQTALRVGKRVRTESTISQGAISHSQAVIECLLSEKIQLKNALITMLGINKLNEDIIKFLNAKEAFSIFLGNRYFEKAQDMAEKYQCKAFHFDEMSSFLEYTDVLITATSAPHIVVKPEHISTKQNIIIFDLGFPRDVDERIGNMPNVTLYNLEDIKNRVHQNMEARRHKMLLANEIIEEEINLFSHLYTIKEV